ncbi:nickel pincer cofactor biosynthesis protein LarB [Pseudooceanicola sp. C21-150M6]|uniref:nickel pincer cofactor biosynthesis protein LarB n=1 Tax=Pseudooceanicola sp. C21-150M6 TaxID=3434355 RepID=UPI003D7FDB51
MDWQRAERIGLPEAIHAEAKSAEQIDAVLTEARRLRVALLITRLGPEKFAQLEEAHRQLLDFDPVSRTAILPGLAAPAHSALSVGIVTGGLADMPTALEAARTLAFSGVSHSVIPDVGVAGLWRLTDRLSEIRRFDVIIAVAGMEGALFSVLGGLVSAPIIAVPAPVGDGVAAGGITALHSALASCSSGLVAVNIGNGFGAAHAAMRMGRLQSAPAAPATPLSEPRS